MENTSEEPVSVYEKYVASTIFEKLVYDAEDGLQVAHGDLSDTDGFAICYYQDILDATLYKHVVDNPFEIYY